MSDYEHDLGTIRDALIVLSGHLPLFATDPTKVQRANQHLALRDNALDALDRIADGTGNTRPIRSTRL